MIIRHDLARRWARVADLKAKQAGATLLQAQRAVANAQHARLALVDEHTHREDQLLHEPDGIDAAWLGVVGGSRVRLAEAIIEADKETAAAAEHVNVCTEDKATATRWREVSARVEADLKREAMSRAWREDQALTDQAASRQWQSATPQEA